MLKHKRSAIRGIVSVLVLMAVQVVAITAPSTHEVTITDRGNWALPWIKAIMVFGYDPVAKVRSDEPLLLLEDILSDPVKINLPTGHYELVLQVLEYGVKPLEISLGYIKIDEAITIDLSVLPLPFELFVPS